MQRLVPLAVALLGAAVLLGLAWTPRHDPRDLGVIGAGLVGLALLLRNAGTRAGAVRLPAVLLTGLLVGVAVYGVGQPLTVLAFGLIWTGVQLLLRRLFGRR
ncbi:hypothetical protein Dcar01_01865 [Deinococcus carri]|uniref:Uncharacterized protein n=1 Tax=Deinococcus carri TaxID=1211323 RepID=A0ABP9W738_9DEIO